MAAARTSTSARLHRVDDAHVIRYAAFLVLEGGFTALAWYCHARPRALPQLRSAWFQFDFINASTVKSGFIALFNLWHTIAIACGSEICYEAFSREWDARWDERARTEEKAKTDEKMRTEETDEVSKVTGGFMDRIFYFIKPRATNTFRIAFLMFLGLVVMGMTGTSAVTVNDGYESDMQLNIGLINTGSLLPGSTNSNSSVFNIRLAASSMAVRLEQLDGAPWGYVPPPNWLVPLPVDILGAATQVTYDSDLASFHHQCRWQAPDSVASSIVTLGSDTWGGTFIVPTNSSEALSGSTISNGSSILELSPIDIAPTGTSAYLFLGGNSTYPVNSNDTHLWIDLSSQPTIYNPNGILTLQNENSVRSPVASVLICDPRLTFTSGSVILAPTSNLTAPDITVRPNGPQTLDNIDETAARSLFTSVLSTAVNQPDPSQSTLNIGFINFNAVAGRMLLDLPPWPFDWNTINSVHPSNLTVIQDRVDSFTLSALKAFTSGYKNDANIRQVTGTFKVPVAAQSTIARLALTTSIQFAILHSVLFAALTIGLAGLAHLNLTLDRPPFTLKVLKQAYGGEGTSQPGKE